RGPSHGPVPQPVARCAPAPSARTARRRAAIDLRAPPARASSLARHRRAVLGVHGLDGAVYSDLDLVAVLELVLLVGCVERPEVEVDLGRRELHHDEVDAVGLVDAGPVAPAG